MSPPSREACSSILLFTLSLLPVFGRVYLNLLIPLSLHVHPSSLFSALLLPTQKERFCPPRQVLSFLDFGFSFLFESLHEGVLVSKPKRPSFPNSIFRLKVRCLNWRWMVSSCPTNAALVTKTLGVNSPIHFRPLFRRIYRQALTTIVSKSFLTQLMVLLQFLLLYSLWESRGIVRED